MFQPNQPSPSRATRRSAPLLSPPMRHRAGPAAAPASGSSARRSAGRDGRRTSSRPRSTAAAGPSRYSSVMAPRWSNGTPSASNSSRIQPTPTPKLEATAAGVVERGQLPGPQQRVTERRPARSAVPTRTVLVCSGQRPDRPSADRRSPAAVPPGSCGSWSEPGSGRVRVHRLVRREEGHVLGRPDRGEAEALRRCGRSAPGSRTRTSATGRRPAPTRCPSAGVGVAPLENVLPRSTRSSPHSRSKAAPWSAD